IGYSLRLFGCIRVRSGRAGVVPELPCRGVSRLVARAACAGGAGALGRAAQATALPAVPLARRAARRPGRRVRRIVRDLPRLRLTLANLLLLFLSMIAGTFVNPSNDSLVNIERAFAARPWVLGAYRWFELYDLFHSWWFTALMTSLALNLIACSLERLPRIYYLVRYQELRLYRVIGLTFRLPPTPTSLTAHSV